MSASTCRSRCATARSPTSMTTRTGPRPSRRPASRTRPAMSEGNVETVRRIYTAVAERDDVTPFEIYAEDIVWDLSHTGRALMFKQPVYEGHDGVRQAWRETLGAFGEVDFDVEEMIDAGPNVLVVLHERALGR